MTIAIARAKALFSRCVARARRGEEIIITDRGVPVAKLTPLEPSVSGLAPHELEMVRAGRLRPPSKKWGEKLFASPPIDLGASALRELLEERKEGR